MRYIRGGLRAAVAVVSVIGGAGCGGGPVYTDSSNPTADPNAGVCRVWAEGWLGDSAPAFVRAKESNVDGNFGMSSTAVLRGEDVIITGWLGDIEAGRVSGDRFTTTMDGYNQESDPITTTRASIGFEHLLGEDRLEFQSRNCSTPQIALGAAHLTALVLHQKKGQQNMDRRKKQKQREKAARRNNDPRLR